MSKLRYGVIMRLNDKIDKKHNYDQVSNFLTFKVEIDIRRHNYDIEIQNWDTESLQNNESELWTIMGKKNMM